MNYHDHAWLRLVAVFIGIFLICIGASAQDAAVTGPYGIQSPLPVSVMPNHFYRSDPSVKTEPGVKVNFYDGVVHATTAVTPGPDGVRRLTLDEAQKAARDQSDPLVRLGQLSVETAKQHRQGVQGLYYPNVSALVENTHLNKATGQVLTLPRSGVSVPVNVFGKDNTLFNAIVAQPITPLFSIRHLVKIARADENIARAKAGMPVAEVSLKVEKNFFDLLIAQQELTAAEAEAKQINTKWRQASSSGTPVDPAALESDKLGVEKSLLLSNSKVTELTESLDLMIGLPEGTKLELVAPEPFADDLSLSEAMEKAETNPELIEAEQTAVKAHSGLALTKLAYLPTVAVIGGYTRQSLISSALLPKDFSYIGVIATFTFFDGFKREHTIKEVKAQSEMADLGVQLTKAKVAAKVKVSYLELDRSRQLYQLTCRMVSASEVVQASYITNDPQVLSARAKMRAEMYRAEAEYRQAYANLRALMGR